ncbi:hypothetical protein Ndes2526B_g07419 [Nannochloris sp. 'desiccata']
MEARMAAMVDNLTSDRADRFEQGCREAAAMIDMLQGSLSFPASSGSSQKVTATLLVSASRILEESLKYPNDVARHHTLRSLAAALAEALVPGNQSKGGGTGDTSQRTALSEQEQKRSEMEKIINSNLSNDVLDWGAAALLSQNVLLATANNNAIRLPSLYLLQANNLDNQSFNTLNSLLQLSIHVPSLDSISGAPSTLLRRAQQVPLPSFSTCSTAGDKHSQEAWTAYLTIHPQALQELLAGVLSHATTTTRKTTSSSIKASVHSKPEWKSGIEAIAASPALHIAARSIFRAWFATSGNMHAWLLHWHVFKLSSGSDNHMKLPYYLYPGELRNTAECVFEAGLSLEASMNSAVKEEKERLTIAALGAGLQSIRRHAMDDEMFSLLLDGFELTKAALEQLLWTQEGDRKDDQGGNTEMVYSTILEKKEPYFRSPVPRNAAEWLALVMWPFNTTQQRLMCDAVVQNNSSTADVVEEVHQSISILQSIWCPILLN